MFILGQIKWLDGLPACLPTCLPACLQAHTLIGRHLRFPQAVSSIAVITNNIHDHYLHSLWYVYFHTYSFVGVV